jgi:hypothetical protein
LIGERRKGGREGGREEGLSEELKDFRGNNGGCQSGF